MQAKLEDKVQADKIHFVDFKILKGQIESSEDFIVNNIKGYDFQLGLVIGFNIDELLAKSDYTVEIMSKSEGKNKSETKAVFHFMFVFKIDNLKNLTKGTGKNFQIDILLGNTLASISHSTARGILLTRFQGTSLQNFILPVIDPASLLIENKKSGSTLNILNKV